MRRFHPRSIALAALIAAGTASSPQTATAQFVVFDPSNLGQQIVGYALQGLEYAEATQAVINLGRQIQQLDDQIDHLRDAATGRIAAMTAAFTQLSSDPASLLKDVGVGWATDFTGSSADLLDEILDMDGGSLVTHLTGELRAADVVGEADLLGLYAQEPDRGVALAEAWARRRESADRVRAGDFATAEAAGRVTALLANAQTSIAGRRGQSNLSTTALQQAQVANQLTEAEINVALAQLLAVQAQQSILERQEQELIARQRLERWVAAEAAWQIELQELQDAEDGRVAEYRRWLRLPERHGN